MIQFKQGETVYIGRIDYVINQLFDDGTIIIERGGGEYDLDALEVDSFLRHAPYDVPDETPKPVFADAKVGDEVWSSIFGKITIIDVDDDLDHPIRTSPYDFGYDGRIEPTDTYPTLFPSLQACKEYWASVEA